jgi:hypothetical protein
MTLQQSVTLLRRLFTALRERWNGQLPPLRFPPIDADELRGSLSRGLQGIAGEVDADLHHFRLAATSPPWYDTGLDLAPGQWLSWFATGRVELSKALDIAIGPDFELWGRIGDGHVFRGTRPSHSVQAERGGRVCLASYFPGEWATPAGDLATPAGEYARVSGGLDVAVVRWHHEALAGLAALRQRTDPAGLVSGEVERLRVPVPPPAGWEYLWFLGPAEIYRAGETPGSIHCHTRADVGILQRDVDLPLRADTRLDWRWRVDALPSRFAEDTLPTHDYVSIAVEFENGIDITYYWSVGLPVGRGYWCPLPTWHAREFHVVVRSGPCGLGTWCHESRLLSDDYRRYVGEPPARIRRLWLIANSLFQRRDGRCEYADIRLHSADSVVRVA